MNSEQVSERILKSALRKEPEEFVIGDVSTEELLRLIAGNFTSCPACGAEPWTNIDCHVCEIMGVIESTPKVDQVAAERARCAAICDAHAAELQATADKYPAGTAACFAAEAMALAKMIRGEKC